MAEVPSPSSAAALRPLVKWAGGKRRELPQLLAHLPPFTAADDWTYVEPFVGGGALFFALEHPRSVINDADAELVNFYRVAARRDPRLLTEVGRVAALFGPQRRSAADQARQAAAYYGLRGLDRDGGLAHLPDWQRAARFFVVNQLAFSGLRRFNQAGEFNVPFGKYARFNDAALASLRHTRLLRSTSIRHGDYAAVLATHDQPATFVFVDPPYTRVMRSYSAGGVFGEVEQRELARRLTSLRSASWLLVIDRSALTEELYGDYVVDSYPLSYGVNIKNRFDGTSEHLVAANYVTLAGARPAVLDGTAAR